MGFHRLVREMEHGRELFRVQNAGITVKEWDVPIDEINHEKLFKQDPRPLEAISRGAKLGKGSNDVS